MVGVDQECNFDMDRANFMKYKKYDYLLDEQQIDLLFVFN